VFASKTDMKIPSVVTYPSGLMRKYKSVREKITIHNHPRSYPPSMGDFVSAFRNDYSMGIIACHDGTIFVYKSLGEPDAETYSSIYNESFRLGYSDYTSHIMALKNMSEQGQLFFKEVYPNDANTRR
jgi:hypothetical protein